MAGHRAPRPMSFEHYTSKLVLVSKQLLQDSAFDMAAWLSVKLGTRIARIVNTHCTTGDGASKPTGILTATPFGYTAGNSTTSGETANITYDDLIELEHSVGPSYRKNAQFMLSDQALKIVKKLKDGIGRPLWMAGLAEKEPDTINAFPYTINLDMPTPAASTKSVLFGDFSNYFMRRIAGIQVLRLTERYADFNQVGFLAFQRWDGQLVGAGTHPIRYLQQASSRLLNSSVGWLQPAERVKVYTGMRTFWRLALSPVFASIGEAQLSKIR